MGDKIINSYQFVGAEPEWTKLKRLFSHNVSRYNVPFFRANSEQETQFLEFCRGSSLTFRRYSIIEYEYDSQAHLQNKFLYLVIKDDKGASIAENQRSFLNDANTCHGGGSFGICGQGAKQRDQISLKPAGIEVVSNLGLVSTRFPVVPKIYLVSAAVADALKSAGATGCEITATDSPECFQLRINSETLGPARIGEVRMGKRCPNCGVAKLFFGSCERYFHRDDLMETDFQNCRIYWGDNVGCFEILNGFPIVSQRVFDLLLEMRVKGLDRYSTDPPIRHAIVQVHAVLAGAGQGP